MPSKLVREVIDTLGALIYKGLARESRANFVLSPLSATIALSLLHNGAERKTAREIRDVLHLPEHLPDNPKEIEDSFKDLLDSVKKSELNEIRIAYKIFVTHCTTISEDFRAVAQEKFCTEVENMNFLNLLEIDKNIDNINKWVKETTNNTVVNIVQSSNFNKDTKMFLVNALYFAASWRVPFSCTEKGTFYKTPNDTFKVNIMSTVFSMRYYENEELQVKYLQMRFKDDDSALVFILPFEKYGLSRIERQIDKIFSLEPAYKIHQVSVKIPKFKIENKIEIMKILKDVGINQAFGPLADFTGIGGKRGEIYVGEIVQKACFECNEEGITPGAATKSVSRELKSVMAVTEIKEFHADHPFVFYLEAADNIVYAGRVVRPFY